MNLLRMPTAGALATLTLVVPAARAQQDSPQSPLLRTMREEIARSMAGLRIPDQPAPYYIAYTIDDLATARVSATFGAIVDNQTSRMRLVRVDVRVGSYDRDNSRFISFDLDLGSSQLMAQGTALGPIDDDMDALRRQLWLATDMAYKRALTAFSKKQAVLQNQVTAEPIPDFSREAPHERIGFPVAPTSAAASWVPLVRELSTALASSELTSSEVEMSVRQGTRYYANSEGSASVEPVQQAALNVTAETQAGDGMALRDWAAAYAKTPEQLPRAADLLERTRELAAGLIALRSASIGEAYTGPVLVEGTAAPALLSQTLVPLFLSLRPPDSENPQMLAAMARLQASPYLTRMGSKIMPDAFSVKDTPSLTRYEKQDIPGAYAVDDEGVAAQDVTLCENGTLKTLLTSRTPQRGLLRSNGHGRGGMAQAGVFQVTSSAGAPLARLRENYLAKLKQDGRAFGYIVRTVGRGGADFDPEEMMMRPPMMAGGPAPAGPQIVRAFKVTPDGKEVLVRGMRFGAVTHNTYRTILEASAERTLYSYRPPIPMQMRMPFMASGPPGGEPVVSLIVPSLIFEELEIEPPSGPNQRAPIVPSPLSGPNP